MQVTSNGKIIDTNPLLVVLQIVSHGIRERELPDVSPVGDIALVTYAGGEYTYYFNAEVAEALNAPALNEIKPANLPPPERRHLLEGEYIERREAIAQTYREALRGIDAPALLWYAPNGIALVTGGDFPAPEVAIAAGYPYHNLILSEPEPVEVTSDKYFPVPRSVDRSAGVRVASAGSPLAKRGIETALLKYSDGELTTGELDGPGYLTALVLLRYAEYSLDPLVRGLWEGKGQIWLPRGARSDASDVEALYPYCFNKRQPTAADIKNIRKGYESLQEKRILVYNKGGDYVISLAPWVRVLDDTPADNLKRDIAEHLGVNPSGPELENIRSGVFIMPDALLDFYYKEGFIKTPADFTDRLAEAREATALYITAERITLALRVCDEIHKAADGFRSNRIRESGEFIELYCQLNPFFYEALNLGPATKRRQPARAKKQIADGLKFIKAGGFIDKYKKWTPRKGGSGYILYVRKASTYYQDLINVREPVANNRPPKSRPPRQLPPKPAAIAGADPPAPLAADAAAVAAWREAIDKANLDREEVAIWLLPATPIAVTNTTLTVSVPNELYAKFIREQYLAKLEAAAGREITVTGGPGPP